MGYRLLKLLVFPLRVVWLPLRGLIWLIEELSGEHRRSRETEQLRGSLAERPPLADEAFLEQLGIPAEEAPVWLAVRRVVASCCYLPETALYPDDRVSELELLFSPPPDARWFELGANWFEVLVHLEHALGIQISEEEVQQRSVRASQAGQLQSFRQVAAVYVGVIRGTADPLAESAAQP